MQPGLLRQSDLLPPRRRALCAVAAPIEAAAVLRARGSREHAMAVPWTLVEMDDTLDLLLTGVGKANAAAAIAARFDPARHALVLNLGVAGALPVEHPLRVGQLVLASRSGYADEGVAGPKGFADIASLGFAPGPTDDLGVAAAPHPLLLDALRPRADAVAPIATVSTCAGTDALARDIALRTGASAEAMEGAAIAFTLLHLAAAAGSAPVPFLEARTISNTTGDRPLQEWDLPGALERLAALVRLL